MFERASREKYRFQTSQGMINSEDLWDIPLPTIDTLALQLQRETKEDNTSFIRKVDRSDDLTKRKFEVVKHVIEVRLAAEEEAKQRILNQDKKQKILAIIAAKQTEGMMGMNEDELKALLADL